MEQSDAGLPLAYIEVTPLQLNHLVDAEQAAPAEGTDDSFSRNEKLGSDYDCIPSFTAASIKYQLEQLSTRAQLGGEPPLVLLLQESLKSDPLAPQHEVSRTMSSSILSGKIFLELQDCVKEDDSGLVLLLKQSDPSFEHRHWPCTCHGFVITSSLPFGRQQFNKNYAKSLPCRVRVRVTESTMVRVVGSMNQLWKERLTGEQHVLKRDQVLREQSAAAAVWNDDELVHNHNPETIRELKFHLQRLLSKPTWIGTTPYDLAYWRRKPTRNDVHMALQSYMIQRRNSSSKSTAAPAEQQGRRLQHADKNSSPFFQEGALLVHSPDHGAGKTSLVEMLLRTELQCHRVHIIHPGPLLAKYGVHADAALSVIVHQAVLSAAFYRERVAVILDHLDAFLPSTEIDAALPVLNGMASYLQQLTHRLERRHELPFPSPQSAALYNWSSNSHHGYVLPVQFCLVGIVTCADDDSNRSGSTQQRSVLDSIRATRYRLPALSAATRLTALQWAFQQQRNLQLSERLKRQLALLAASAVWARGADFGRIAQQMAAQKATTGDEGVDSEARQPVTVELCQRVLARASGSVGNGCDVQFVGSDPDEPKNGDLFSSIGGNYEAKVALEDALALHPERRSLLDAVGLAPPMGILLYGAPVLFVSTGGCTGKTMLARAVAKLLRSNSTAASSSVGGAFISMTTSDIVRAEVGSGEKMVARAFETAKLNAPSVVFIDEFQALFTERKSSGGSTRLSTTLLVCMDDLKRWRDISEREEQSDIGSTRGSHVVVLAATNTPWMVDGSFLRPGRFDRAVHVGLPDSGDRAAIFNLHLSRMKIKTDSISDMCVRLAGRTKGFSGADIAALCRATAVRCCMLKSENVEEAHFFSVLDDGLYPSSDAKLVSRIKEWRLK